MGSSPLWPKVFQAKTFRKQKSERHKVKHQKSEVISVGYDFLAAGNHGAIDQKQHTPLKR